MIAEYLGQIGYKAETCVQGFLISMVRTLDELREMNKKIVLFGIGENGFYAEQLLRDVGIDIYAYADNTSRFSQEGRTLRGKKIYLSYDLFDKEDMYFVIAVGKNDIDCVRLQLMTHRIEDYSIFLPNSFWHFTDEEKRLRNIVVESVNQICFEGEKAEDAMPYQGIAVGGDGKKLGILNYLLHSTIQTGYAYQWEKQIVEALRVKRVLEVGPGYGLMSLVLLKQFDDISIDWIIFGEPEEQSQYSNGLKKVKTQYKNKININYGYIERNEFVIPGKYDLIVMTEVFEHFALNPVNTLIKLKAAMNVGGKLVLTTPNWGHVNIYKTWRDMPDAGTVDHERYMRLTKCGHAYQYSKDELLEIFNTVGLKVEKYAVTNSGHHNFVLF